MAGNKVRESRVMRKASRSAVAPAQPLVARAPARGPQQVRRPRLAILLRLRRVAPRQRELRRLGLSKSPRPWCQSASSRSRPPGDPRVARAATPGGVSGQLPEASPSIVLMDHGRKGNAPGWPNVLRSTEPPRHGTTDAGGLVSKAATPSEESGEDLGPRWLRPPLFPC